MTAATKVTPESLYLDLLKQCLTRSLFPERLRPWRRTSDNRIVRVGHGLIQRYLASRGISMMEPAPFTPAVRETGRDWPLDAETMVGRQRLDNLEHCIVNALHEGIAGDLVETGVWRGGAAIFMRAVLKAYRSTDRVVWAADSFAGLPKPEPTAYAADITDRFWAFPELAVPLEIVKANFAKYDLLDEQVRFLVGWFKDTLPSAPIEQIAVLRLDGDMYESTTDTLEHLYAKVSVGGYCIVDDYGAVEGCRAAVTDFRSRHGVTEEIRDIDGWGVFWKKERGETRR